MIDLSNERRPWVVAKFPGDEDVAASLQDVGVHARVTRAGIVVPLAARGETFVIPEELRPYRPSFWLDLAEHGGRIGSAARGVIVCGEHGEQLRPYVRTDRGGPVCGVHARFSTRGIALVVEASPTDEVVIRTLSLQRLGAQNSVTIRERVWHGDAPTIRYACDRCGRDRIPGPLDVAEHRHGPTCSGRLVDTGIRMPPLVSRFQDAVLAARQKAQCPSCTHVHYATQEVAAAAPQESEDQPAAA